MIFKKCLQQQLEEVWFYPSYIRNMLANNPNKRINIAVIGIAGDRKLVRGIKRGKVYMARGITLRSRELKGV